MTDKLEILEDSGHVEGAKQSDLIFKTMYNSIATIGILSIELNLEARLRSCMIFS